MSTLVAEVRKQLLVALADTGNLVALIVVPLIVVLFLGYAEEGLIVSDSRYRLPVADLDQSPTSAKLVESLRTDGHLDVSVQSVRAFTAADAARELSDGKLVAVMVIPRGTGGLLAAGQHVSLPLYFDPSQQTRAGLMILTIQRIADRFSAPAEVVSIVSHATGMPPAAIATAVRRVVAGQLAGPQFALRSHAATRGRSLPNGFDEAVPGIALMWSLSFLSFGAIAADEERHTYHTWQRTDATPASRLARVCGWLLANYIRVGVQVGILFLVGAMVFRMDVGNVGALCATLAAFVTVPAAASVLFAAFAVSGQLIDLAARVGMFVVGAVSGAFVPLYLLPRWLERVAIFSPLYWAISAVQDVMIRGAGPADVVTPVLALLALASALIAVSMFQFRRARQ